MNSNLYLWEQTRKPDPDHLKWVGVGRGYTTADAQYQIEKTTKVFGPYGSGWGIDNLQYEIVYGQGEPQKDKNGMIVGPPAAFPVPIMAILKGDLWWNEVKGQARTMSNGIVTMPLMEEVLIPAGRFPLVTCKQWAQDDDLFKKLSTDLQSKMLSKIGIDADLFKGLWGKEGSKKGSGDPVVYLGTQPLLDVPRAKEIDLLALLKAMDDKVLTDEQKDKAKAMLDDLNWNHFAVRAMAKKLKGE